MAFELPQEALSGNQSGGQFVLPPDAQPVTGGGGAVQPVAASMAYQEAGAPYGVRIAVGAARPRDRLATIRHFFPDAEPVEGDNFIYTDPKTGKRTLYNPTGLDMGDWSSLGREAAQSVGGLIGGVVGAPAGLVGAPAGGILGAMAGDQVVDAFLRLAGIGPSGGAAETATDTAKDAISAASGEAFGLGAGKVLSKAAKMLPNATSQVAQKGARIARPGVDPAPSSAEITEAIRRLNLPPATPGMVGNPFLARLENALEGINPVSPLRRRSGELANTAATQLDQAVPRPSGGVVPSAPNPATAVQSGGEAAASAAANRLNVFRARRQAIDDNFMREVNAVAPNASFSVDALRTMRGQLQQRVAASPQMRGPLYDDAMRTIDNMIADADARGGRVPISLMREWRTEIGELAFPSKPTADRTPQSERVFKDVYGALRQDIIDAANAVSPAAARKLGLHDRLVTRFTDDAPGTTSISDQITDMMNKGTFDKVYNAMKTGSTGAIRTILKHASPDDRATIARAYIDEMTQQADGRLDLLKFSREWRKLIPGVKRELFGPAVNVAAIDDIATVLSGARNKAAVQNFSNTANQQGTMDYVKGMGNALVAMVAGQAVDMQTVLATMAIPTVLDTIMANKAASRGFANMLTRLERGGKAVPMPPAVAELVRQATTKLAGREVGRAVGSAIVDDDPLRGAPQMVETQ